MEKALTRTRTLQIIFLCIGILSATLGLKGFLLPAKLIDGGAVGISLLLANTLEIPLGLFITLINIPFIILGWRILGKSFGIRTIFGISLLSILVSILPIPEITQDPVLVAVFGGFFLGAGIGLAMRGGGVIDGTEILAIYASKHIRMSVGDIILAINILIFCIAAYALGVDVALYSLLTYLTASKTVDFIIEGIEEYTGVTIMSKDWDTIRLAIIGELGRGVTLYAGMGGYAADGHIGASKTIVFTVVTRLEIAKLQNIIERIDSEAFVLMHSIRDTKGGMVKKRILH